MKRLAVIGAGIAGIAAACRLQRHGHRVTVFEARERAGGRVWSPEIATPAGLSVIERGAEFILPNYYRTQELVDEFGLELVDTGMSYYIREPGDAPNITAADITEAGTEAGEIAAATDPDSTAEDILQQLDATPELIDALRCRIEISAAVRSKKVVAGALNKVASFEPLRSYRIGGGNQLLANALAAKLDDAIHFNKPVTAVQPTEGGGVQVSTSNEDSQFDAAIVALPIGVLRAGQMIDVPTTEERERVLAKVVQGHAAKLHVALKDTPATSAVMSVRGRYWTWTAQDASGKVTPVLNSFMGTEEAIENANIENDLSNWLEDARALRPDLRLNDEAVATVWSTDPLALGAYSAHSGEFSAEETAVLEQPIGDIYFAGEYADPTYTGLIEGAIRSGERVADLINNSPQGA
ncbi:MAG: FAD-dependent oxidoreductase [Micrococcaceae bacterium]|nr:FAD-dependent oxidoreductase [Micrococcaceae bacterium]